MKAAFATIVAACALSAPAPAQPMPGHPNVCSGPAAEPGHGGWVLLGFTISTDGTVKAPEILDSSGFADLDQQALECARDFHYKPATLNGKPVESLWRATLRMGDPMAVSEDKRILSEVAGEIRACVLPAGVIRTEPGDMEWTDLRLSFSQTGQVDVSIAFSTGSEALTRKVEDCARAAPALARAAKIIHWGKKTISMNWTNIRQFAPKP